VLPFAIELQEIKEKPQSRIFDIRRDGMLSEMYLDILVIGRNDTIGEKSSWGNATGDKSVVPGTDAAVVESWNNVVQDVTLSGLESNSISIK
jgi:hypothetical protein